MWLYEMDPAVNQQTIQSLNKSLEELFYRFSIQNHVWLDSSEEEFDQKAATMFEDYRSQIAKHLVPVTARHFDPSEIIAGCGQESAIVMSSILFTRPLQRRIGADYEHISNRIQMTLYPDNPLSKQIGGIVAAMKLESGPWFTAETAALIYLQMANEYQQKQKKGTALDLDEQFRRQKNYLLQNLAYCIDQSDPDYRDNPMLHAKKHLAIALQNRFDTVLKRDEKQVLLFADTAYVKAMAVGYLPMPVYEREELESFVPFFHDVGGQPYWRLLAPRKQSSSLIIKQSLSSYLRQRLANANAALIQGVYEAMEYVFKSQDSFIAKKNYPNLDIQTEKALRILFMACAEDGVESLDLYSAASILKSVLESTPGIAKAYLSWVKDYGFDQHQATGQSLDRSGRRC